MKVGHCQAFNPNPGTFLYRGFLLPEIYLLLSNEALIDYSIVIPAHTGIRQINQRFPN